MDKASRLLEYQFMLSNCFPIIKQEPVTFPKESCGIVDWTARSFVKNQILKKHIQYQIWLVGIAMWFVIMPFWVSSSSVGRSLFLSIFPAWVMTLSWMLAAWWAYDKGWLIFLASTYGAVPARLGLGLAWVWITLSTIPDIMDGVYVFGLMGFWTAFTICEISMMLQLSKRLPKAKKEPGW